MAGRRAGSKSRRRSCHADRALAGRSRCPSLHDVVGQRPMRAPSPAELQTKFRQRHLDRVNQDPRVWPICHAAAPPTVGEQGGIVRDGHCHEALIGPAQQRRCRPRPTPRPPNHRAAPSQQDLVALFASSFWSPALRVPGPRRVIRQAMCPVYLSVAPRPLPCHAAPRTNISSVSRIPPCVRPHPSLVVRVRG